MEGDLTQRFYQRQKNNQHHHNNNNNKPTTDIIKSDDRTAVTHERKFQWGKRLSEEVDMTGKFIKTISPLPPCCTNPDEEQTDIQEFYRGADVLITGATGFMGKILIEKLLVSCPNIGNLYLLIREKKGKSSEERFNILFQDDVFARLHKLVPNFRSKLIGVNGDVTQPNLGMSESDFEAVTKNVSVIFHGAANVRFDETLKSAVSINIRGVLEMLKLAKKCHSLKSILHVSTAYSNCTVANKQVTEEFYPAAYDYKKILELVDTQSDEVLEKMTASFISPWPNTYSFTKQIAEDMIQKEGRGLPLAILRPGIIIATYNEPLRGWTDNLYGPTGVIIGVGTGVLRVLNIDKDAVANMVPVDMVVNAAIVAAWKTCQNYKNGERSIKIYNHVSSGRNPIRWGEFSYWSNLYGQNWPTVLAIWYKEFHLIRNRLLFLLVAFFLHTLPSYIADGMFLLCGKRPKMIKIYKKISKFSQVITYFSVNTWNFPDDNTVNLWRGMSPRDQEIYPFDIAELDWDFHAQAHCLGLRVYLTKDDIHTLDNGRRKWKRLKYLHRCLQVVLLSFFSWVIYRLFHLVNSFT